ncbi:hypothetical protein PRUPE_6G295300 [Prunus persica]|uniref:High mobility group B protein 6 n=1 Tax=Prunus persica TaxID=3760 RepID=A0A251NXG8_PRUPE|nr:high mobility group B protein 6 [Prunus persica]ONI03987.1 hypothetical protein PRUPE_6G295300 [Prunus persica]
MQALQSPVTGDQLLRPKSGRKPLQPRNTRATLVNSNLTKLKPMHKWIGVDDDSNKENRPIYATPTKMIEPIDASLAEELSAIRKKMERLRLDRERTEKMLEERDMVMEMQMKELESRGQIQKMLEIELDRIYRLNQLHTRSNRVSPIRSLREKEQQKKATKIESTTQEVTAEDMEESVDENTPQKLSSASSNSEIVTEKTDK